MEKFLNQTKKIIFQKQQDILSSALILSLMIIISRLFGLIRYRTLATYFTKEELDIFFASFRLPDFVFEILITGALSSAFIPIFIKYKKDPETLKENISSIINFITLSLGVVMLIMFFGAGIITRLIAPGFTESQIENVISLSRILIISQLPFLVLGNIVSGIAQANRIFVITAIAPVLYNIGIILGTVFLADSLWIYGSAIGVVIGASLFFLIQLPVIYFVKFKYVPFVFNKKAFKEFITLFVPRTLSVLTSQIDLTIDLMLSSLLGAGSYTIFFFAQHLQLFPVSFVGMAFGQASLPYLTSLYSEKKIDALKKVFVNSLLQLFYISIPLSFFFIFARTPIVRLIFGGKKFDWLGTNLTALTVSVFAFSIPFHTIFYFITRAFYATHDTKTPFIINFIAVFINASLSAFFILVLHFPVWSLALSFSISVSVNVLLLLTAFHKKINGFNVTKFVKNTIKIYITAFISSLAPYFVLKLLDQLVIDTTRTINVFFLLGISFTLFGFSYLFFSWLFTVEEIYILGKLLLKVKSMKQRFVEVYTESG